MLIQAGTYEILLSDSQTIYEKCLEPGVDVTFTQYEGMFHVFQIICGRVIPEVKDAWKEVESFISKIYQ